jgi:uncharacterized membrane protein
MERIARFREELAELEQEQGLILTGEQRSHLEQHLSQVQAGLAGQYGLEASESARRVSWGMRVASLLGAAALGAAVVLFLHRIWGHLPTPVHAALLVGLPAALLGSAELAYRRGVDPFYTALLAVGSSVAFVMGLSASGSVFNSAPSPHALLAWSAFAILVGYTYGLRWLLGAGLLLACGYVGAMGTAASGGYWETFMEHTLFLIPPGAVVYALAWSIRGPDPNDFGFVYRMSGAIVGLTALLLLSVSGHLCCSPVSASMMEGVYQLTGLLLSVGVVTHGLRLGRGGLVNLGAVMFVIFLYARLHAWWWDWLPKYLFFLLLGLIALTLLLVFRRLRARLSERPQP